MINLSDLMEILGRPISDPQLALFFLHLGINVAEEAELEDGLFSEYIDREGSGLSFLFTDEAMFLNKKEKIIGEGELYFDCVFFYAEGKDGFAQYEGELPKGLSFSMSRQNINKKLGPPSFQVFGSDNAVAHERWDFSGHRVNIAYWGVKEMPAIISLYVPYVDEPH